MAKKKKKDSEKLSPEELNPEPKVATITKRKSASPEPKTLVREEDTPASPSAVEVEEIMKVMTEPLPIKLSPLALELTKFFQKDIASAADEEVDKVAKKKSEDSEKLSPEELNPEPKVATARKRKIASPEPETLVREEDTPVTPSAA